MPEQLELNRPWLVAVWPGMGQVALNAGVYLLAKFGMVAVAELETGDLFDIDHVEVKNGLVQPARRPRNRFFVRIDPAKKRDLLLFVGEAQPPTGRYTYCRHVVEFAKANGVERVFTFAAMATQMHPEHDSRVFGAATDQVNLEELKRLELTSLEDSRIGGLNGVLLAAAAEAGLPGVCLLGEMPHIFTQVPFPKASLGILEAFSAMSGIEIDLTELADQARAMDAHLGELLARVDRQLGGQAEPMEEEEEGVLPEPTEEDKEAAVDRARIERMFATAELDRSKAFELKQELDRLGLFKEYEDRFLDLFKKAA